MSQKFVNLKFPIVLLNNINLIIKQLIFGMIIVSIQVIILYPIAANNDVLPQQQGKIAYETDNSNQPPFDDIRSKGFLKRSGHHGRTCQGLHDLPW
ncbi:hypothetical protein C8R30_12538 [Nitrosomonas nitrosa]|uniref:Uncharacterized protein n=1 Tax=Nitrosomonas nitrosa TaxID=52442 RepID=A0A1I4TDM2_9PROT|nr:hypothetical protein C8R30_12538 [Nitrosomonas nitrosa]SFM74670.1 hypothetical protein SAMN05421880_1317 [Nitrosomonas nitrosa]